MDARTRMKLAEEESDRLLQDGGIQAPDTTNPTADDKPAEPTGISDGEPKAAEPSQTEPPKSDQSIEQLKSEIAKLTAIISDENSQTYKARYQSLQGMFNAETAKLRGEIEELKKKVEAPAPAKMEDSADYATLVEEVGEKTAKLLKPYLDKISLLEGTISSMSGDVKTAQEKTAQVEKMQTQSADDIFFSRLNDLAPDWKTINGWPSDGITQDARFTGFMGQPIPGTAFTYQDALNDHYQNRNVAKVAEIFDIFKKSIGVAKADTPKQAPASNNADKHIEPDKTGKGSQVPNSQPEMIPHAEYEAFVDSIRKRTFKGTMEERKTLEARYDKAFAENRIR